MRTLTLEEAADVLKTTAETVSDCIRSRGLPAARIGRAYVLVDVDVIEWLRGQYIQKPASGTTPAAPTAALGLASPSTKSALDAALAPSTGAKRRNRTGDSL